MRIHTYRDLEVWKSAMDVVEEVYVVTRRFPREELYGLTSQVRRAGVSVPSNIAEGWGLESDRGFFHRLSIGQGSLAETETQLLIAERLDLAPGRPAGEVEASASPG